MSEFNMPTIEPLKFYKNGSDKPKKEEEFVKMDISFNEPEHYHQYEIDTIEFLQKGFPPEVFRGFAIGSITKYLHRAQEKNGLNDYLKAMDYAKRLYEFEKDSGRP